MHSTLSKNNFTLITQVLSKTMEQWVFFNWKKHCKSSDGENKILHYMKFWNFFPTLTFWQKIKFAESEYLCWNGVHSGCFTSCRIPKLQKSISSMAGLQWDNGESKIMSLSQKKGRSGASRFHQDYSEFLWKSWCNHGQDWKSPDLESLYS